jgi:hypothetical protein
VVRFRILGPPYPQGKRVYFSLDWWLAGAQSRSARGAVEKKTCSFDAGPG